MARRASPRPIEAGHVHSRCSCRWTAEGRGRARSASPHEGPDWSAPRRRRSSGARISIKRDFPRWDQTLHRSTPGTQFWTTAYMKPWKPSTSSRARPGGFPRTRPTRPAGPSRSRRIHRARSRSRMASRSRSPAVWGAPGSSRRCGASRSPVAERVPRPAPPHERLPVIRHSYRRIPRHSCRGGAAPFGWVDRTSHGVPLSFEHGESGGEAGVQVPLLPVRPAGPGAEPHVRLRPEGLQPGVGGPHQGLVRRAAPGDLRAVLGDVDRVEARPRAGLPRRGVVGAVAAGPATPAGRVHERSGRSGPATRRSSPSGDPGPLPSTPGRRSAGETGS